jgi:membrane protein DedA with SNARE-associated domain
VNDWIVKLIEQSSYLGVAFLMFLETVFPPIPSELIMSVSGLAAARGKIDLYGAIAAGTAGAMLGNLFWYLAARALGIQRLQPIIFRWGRWLTLTWGEVRRAERWFAAHGTAFVLLGRMIPTVRSLVSIPAGLLKMRFRTFMIASTIGTAGWTAALAFAGFKMGEKYTQVDAWVGPVSTAVLVLLAIGYVYRVITHRGHDPREGDDSGPDLPLL